MGQIVPVEPHHSRFEPGLLGAGEQLFGRDVIVREQVVLNQLRIVRFEPVRTGL